VVSTAVSSLTTVERSDAASLVLTGSIGSRRALLGLIIASRCAFAPTILRAPRLGSPTAKSLSESMPPKRLNKGSTGLADRNSVPSDVLLPALNDGVSARGIR